MNQSPPSSRRTQLKDDPGVAELSQALALGERFHLHLVICTSGAVVGSLIGLAREHLAAVNVARQVERRAPSLRRATPMAALTREDLTIDVLDLLRAGAERARIVVLDATDCLARDDDAWAWCFGRMNELRNSIIEAFRGELVLCLPARLERLFAKHAPDFWSVRSVTITLVRKISLASEDTEETPE